MHIALLRVCLPITELSRQRIQLSLRSNAARTATTVHNYGESRIRELRQFSLRRRINMHTVKQSAKFKAPWETLLVRKKRSDVTIACLCKWRNPTSKEKEKIMEFSPTKQTKKRKNLKRKRRKEILSHKTKNKRKWKKKTPTKKKKEKSKKEI